MDARAVRRTSRSHHRAARRPHYSAVADASGWAPLVNDGQLRLLVIWSDKRSKTWPAVPTLKEAGIGLVSNSPFGLAGPKGMDPKVVKILHDAFKKGMDEPSMPRRSRRDRPGTVLSQHRRLSRLRGADFQRAEASDGGSRAQTRVKAQKSDRGAVQIVFVGALDLHGGDLADAQRAAAGDMHRCRRSPARRPCVRPLATVGPTSSMMTCWRVPTLLLLRRCAEIACWLLHEAVPALFLHLLRHGVRRVSFAGAPSHRLVLEAADAVELGFIEPVEQQFEIRLGLAGEADDEGRAQREVGQISRQRAMRSSVFSCAAGPLHALQHIRARVLERDVEIGQHLRRRPSAG